VHKLDEERRRVNWPDGGGDERRHELRVCVAFLCLSSPRLP